MVFQDASGTWYCTGPHDAPINGPGCIKFTLLDVTDSGAIPPGWERVTIDKYDGLGNLLFADAFIKLVDTPTDPPTLDGVINGKHKHPLNSTNVCIDNPAAAVAVGGYTVDAEIDPNRIELAILRRVL